MNVAGSDSEDKSRLPEGFKRVAYDAETQIYFFRDTRTNTLWRGPEGSYYGILTKFGDNSIVARMPSVKSRELRSGEKEEDFDTGIVRRSSNPRVTFDSILGSGEVKRSGSWGRKEEEKEEDEMEEKEKGEKEEEEKEEKEKE